MAINRLTIINFKCFKNLEIELNSGLNVLVGNNDTGKSTILEAINLALTGYYCGKNIKNELSQYLFNKQTIKDYFDQVNKGCAVIPPSIIIEIVFDGNIDAHFEGNKNIKKENQVEGLTLEIAYNSKYNEEYGELLKTKNIKSLPIEYYEVSWITFARDNITTKSIPIKSVLIDSSNFKYQNGSDVYISRIVKNLLEPEEIISIAQAHRKMKDSFGEDESIKKINNKISTLPSLENKKINLAVDLGNKSTWEGSLITQLEEIPLGYIGKGMQCIVKTELALSNNKVKKAQVILLEEPESHLSFSSLNELLYSIKQKYNEKQIIISTHSSFVANKLGLENLILLNNGNVTKITGLDSSDFFKKMAGYDTLRLILCKKAILVEGDSDELVVQKAYMNQNNGKLPIYDQVDVISVGTSFLRFLEIAEKLDLEVAVVTDNDGSVDSIEKKYDNYIGLKKKSNIKICYDNIVDKGDLCIGDKKFNYNTLEPKLLKANDNNISLFEEILGENFTTIDDLYKYMKNNKTDVALAIFNTKKDVKFPDYILEAIKNE